MNVTNVSDKILTRRIASALASSGFYGLGDKVVHRRHQLTVSIAEAQCD